VLEFGVVRSMFHIQRQSRCCFGGVLDKEKGRVYSTI
jgi:hypothetical protein